MALGSDKAIQVSVMFCVSIPRRVGIGLRNRVLKPLPPMPVFGSTHCW